MLNEGKIMLMTKVAIYEKHEENDKLVMARYFREDYIKYGCLKTVVATTIVYWLYVAIYIALNFESILDQLTDLDEISYRAMMWRTENSCMNCWRQCMKNCLRQRRKRSR